MEEKVMIQKYWLEAYNDMDRVERMKCNIFWDFSIPAQFTMLHISIESHPIYSSSLNVIGLSWPVWSRGIHAHSLQSLDSYVFLH